jgi:MFS family permease
VISFSGIANIRRAFTNRNYSLYVAGNLMSTSGNWIQRVAMAWLTWELTHSGAWLGIIAFADMCPTFVIGLFAGTLTDRTDALRLLRVTQMFAIAQAVGLAAVTLSGLVTVEWLLFFALFRGIVVAFNRPPRMTLVYNIVGGEALSSAIAINAMVFNVTRFIGPVLGGAITAWYGAGWAFIANGLSYAGFVAILFAIDIPLTKTETREGASIGAETWEGVRYAFNHAGIALALVILLATSLFARPFTELLPGIASAVFERGVNGYSTLLAFHGVGAMAAGFWMAQRGGAREFTNIIIVSLAVVSVSLIIFSTIAGFWLALPLMVLVGWAIVVQGVATQTLVQTAVATEFRGRTMACYGIIARGGPALGALAMGGLSEFIGLSAPVAGGAVLCLLMWAWMMRRRRQVTRALEGSS